MLLLSKLLLLLSISLRALTTTFSRNITKSFIRSLCRPPTCTTYSAKISKDSAKNSKQRSRKNYISYNNTNNTTNNISCLNWWRKLIRVLTRVLSFWRSNIMQKSWNNIWTRSYSRWLSYILRHLILNWFRGGPFLYLWLLLSCVCCSAPSSICSILCLEVSHISFRGFRLAAQIWFCRHQLIDCWQCLSYLLLLTLLQFSSCRVLPHSHQCFSIDLLCNRSFPMDPSQIKRKIPRFPFRRIRPLNDHTSNSPSHQLILLWQLWWPLQIFFFLFLLWCSDQLLCDRPLHLHRQVKMIIYRWPECNAPGKYDICGHSHQIWHCLVVLGIIFTYYGCLNNYEMRKQAACPLLPSWFIPNQHILYWSYNNHIAP